ncbi:DMT family transporter [Acinetobacter courvalinii]|jgi:drug/metabolite transporter (DMT)-like permease|uniref:DMT family transporter n=1 Tax=Acinetobacter courvalinii TaxID=280147 RepID=UPI0018FF43F5|nr:EamA family transporter [Acinetobacter courvalinii]MBJ8419654.1 EamA family transporter [Acinetobacter courvalinii]
MPSRINLMLTYGLLVFIWATTPLAIVWSVSDLHPMWALLIRFFIALPLAVTVLLLLKVKFPTHKIALLSYAAGSLSLIGSQIFTYAATAYLSSGLIALMFGLAPIMAGLIGRFGFQQKLAGLQWLGMATSIIGLAMICLSGSQQHVQPIGIILMLISVFSYSLSIFLVKKINADLPVMAQATGSILVSTLLATLLIPWIWQYAPTHFPSAKSLFALTYTIVMASLIAMFCYFKLVQNLQATTLSLTTVMTPMLAILIGAYLNHEQISAQVFVGASIILFGLMLYFFRDLRAYRRLKS